MQIEEINLILSKVITKELKKINKLKKSVF